MQDLPVSLLRRLETDERNSLSTLASSDLATSVASVREYASRKLLLATPDAIDALATVSRTGADKDRVSAAKEILAHSPATADAAQTALSASLPPSLAATLAAALVGIVSAFRAASPLSPQPPLEPALRDVTPLPPEPLLVPKENPMKSDPLPIANLPDPSDSSEMTASGLVSKPKVKSPKALPGKPKAPVKKSVPKKPAVSKKGGKKK